MTAASIQYGDTLVKQPKRPVPTHWMDERGLVLTDKQRKNLGGDWAHFYNVPCRSHSGRVTPLHKCSHCAGAGHDPQATYDPCPVCGKSGGRPGPTPDARPHHQAHHQADAAAPSRMASR